MLCDVLWMNRNLANHNSNSLNPSLIAAQVNKVAASHCNAWDFKVFDRGKHSGWSPPTPPNVKVNFDAAVGPNESYLAAVCCDHNAKILGVWSDFCASSDPLIAEARAALLAVKKMKEEGFKWVCFEGDSLIVSQAIQGLSHAQFWTIDCIIAEIRSILPFFSFWLVSHVCRDFNSVAHSVAQWVAACKVRGTISISSIPVHLFEQRAEGDGSSAASF